MSGDRLKGKYEGIPLWAIRPPNVKGPGHILCYESAEQLLADIIEYMKWAEDNPIKEEKVAQYKGRFVRTWVEKPRAMTVIGCCTFLGIHQPRWVEWSKSDRPGFADVIHWAQNSFYEQKFSYAAADILNASIIQRDLGLKDRTDVSNEDGTMQPRVIERRIVRPSADPEGEA